MKKRTLPLTLSMLLLTGSVAYSAPVDTFEQDYQKIAETTLNTTNALSLFKGYEITVKGEARSENIADFEANSAIEINGNERLSVKEVGEVVFTNYAEDRGVATIISSSDYHLYSKKENDESVLMAVKGVNTQSQIDRENLHYKFASQFPTVEFINPDADKRGIIRIENFVMNGDYGFSADFEKLQDLKGHYQTGAILIDLEDEGRIAKLSLESVILDSEIQNQASYQKSVLEVNKLNVSSMNAGEAIGDFSVDKIVYSAGAEMKDGAPYVYGEFALTDIKVTPAERDVTASFGDIKLDLRLAPLAENVFEQLAYGKNSHKGVVDYSDSLAVLKDYFVENSTMEVHLSGEHSGHNTKQLLSITPKMAFIEKLSGVDMADTEAMDELFAGLSFFEFIEQYMDEINVDVALQKNYIIEFGSNILLASGEAENMDVARRQMKEFYQQFQLMAMLINAETSVVEFVEDGVRVQIQYKDKIWYVNGKEFDLELISALLG